MIIHVPNTIPSDSEEAQVMSLGVEEVSMFFFYRISKDFGLFIRINSIGYVGG